MEKNDITSIYWFDKKDAEKNKEDVDKIQLLNETLRNQPNNINSLIQLGDIHCDYYEHKKALEYYNKALDISKNNALALAKKAYITLKNANLIVDVFLL